jgi:carbon-monoxide dehydrogenase large subunit
VPTTLDVDHVVNEPVPSAFPNGCYIAEAEIDPQTGATQVVTFSAVNDLGTIVNPLLVDGQIQGGVVQGLGQVLLEQAVYDSEVLHVDSSPTDPAVPINLFLNVRVFAVKRLIESLYSSQSVRVIRLTCFSTEM